MKREKRGNVSVSDTASGWHMDRIISGPKKHLHCKRSFAVDRATLCPGNPDSVRRNMQKEEGWGNMWRERVWPDYRLHRRQRFTW